MIVALVLTALAAEAAPNTLTVPEQKAGWKLLFDGSEESAAANFRGYNRPGGSGLPPGWSVEDGAIVHDPSVKAAVDVITAEQFGEFELSLEFRVEEGGNSGVLFSVVEQPGKPPWHSGPEIQILDDAGGKDPQKTGWLYQLYRPQLPRWLQLDQESADRLHDVSRSPGEWNDLTLHLTKSQGKVMLNGLVFCKFRVGSDDWNQRVAASKFHKYPEFGKAASGHVALQDHGARVAFRSIKVRDLSETVPDPVDGTVENVTAVKAFPSLNWDGWEPLTESGKQQLFIPVLITGAGDGSGRLFVANQEGVIYSFEEREDVTSSQVFLDIDARVAHRGKLGDEEGLLGLAFHPDFKTNGKFYVYYSLAHTGANQDKQVSILSEFTVSEDDRSVADPSSERELMRIEQPFRNHNGGTILFGDDGYLYVATGDGGAFYDPFLNAQNKSTPLGAVLRIDVNAAAEGKAYGIPSDNPFLDAEGAIPELYAFGFRNPWRLSKDRETGTLWMADVGQDLWEEINIVKAGGNYGWNFREGLHSFGGEVPPAGSEFIDPVWEYDHVIGKSITGGAVYRGSSAPALGGMYVYADYVTGKLFALNYDQDAQAVRGNYRIPSSTNMPVVTFGEGDSGEVYFGLAEGDGRGVYKFVTTEE